MTGYAIGMVQTSGARWIKNQVNSSSSSIGLFATKIGTTTASSAFTPFKKHSAKRAKYITQFVLLLFLAVFKNRE